MIRTVELAKRTGATPRQIDYWVRAGVIPCDCGVGGSGSIRLFDESVVERVEFLVSIIRAFGGGLTTNMLKELYNKYNNGLIELGYGIVIMRKD